MPPCPKVPKKINTLKDIFDAALCHGYDSEPEHEAGDLQDVVTFMWAMLDKGRHQVVLGHFDEYFRANGVMKEK
jgi:hypothetical protein